MVEEELSEGEYIENLKKVVKPFKKIDLPIHDLPHQENLRLFYSLMYANNPNVIFSITDKDGKEKYSDSLSENI